MSTISSEDLAKDFEKIIRRLESYVYRRGINYSLDNFLETLKRFNNPHLSLPPMIHIAGTNGKGSTAAFMEVGLRAKGLSVGVYMSPHLESYTERMRINGELILETEFISIFSTLFEQIQEEEGATEFELLTLGAFLWFNQKKPDILIVETGMGGRLDATNVITPFCSVITRIAYDHQAILGHALAEIASEKAGIIKPTIPVITLENQEKEAWDVIHAEALKKSAPLILTKPLTKTQGFRHLKGAYQAENAALALSALTLLYPHENEKTWLLAFDNAKHPARFEVEEHGDTTLIFDGAHNDSGIQALLHALRHFAPDKKPAFITGITNTKDAKRMLEQLSSYSDDLYYVDFCPGWSYSNQEIEAVFPKEKIRFLTENFTRNDIKNDFIVITGSLYFIGKIRAHITKMKF